MAAATTSGEILKCENCSFETKSTIGLSRHVKQKHGLILSTSKNTCSFCKKVFASSASCTRHITTKVCIPETEQIPIQPIQPIQPITPPPPTPEEKDPQSFPIHTEDKNFMKNSRPFVSTLVKIMICSVFFIPFYQRIIKK